MIKFLDVEISNLPKEEVLRKIKEWLNSRSFHYITTPNPEMIVDAQTNHEFKNIHNNADLTLPDGFGLVLWAYIRGLGKINRISGADICWDVLAMAQELNKKVFLLGAKPGVAKKAAQQIEKELPKINIVGAESGGKLAKTNGKWEFDANLIETINQFSPDILLIGRGHPHQEYFMSDFRNELPSVKLAMGIGGTFDFISGAIKRAPKFLRIIGLEWVWRLFREPKRFSRIYKALIIFSLLALKNKPMPDKKLNVRFAPSPTGFLHIGGLRTALYNWIMAKRTSGTFTLRIENTDRARFVEDAEKDILRALEWIDIVPDYGIYLDKGEIKEHGPHAPYRQSQRLDIYHEHAEKLIKQGMAYYCFCTEDRLKALRDEQARHKQAPRYDKHCRNLSQEEIDNNLKKNIPHVIRLKVPETGETSFDDDIRGKVVFKNTEIDDQVLIKSDKFPTYHLANVVDDHLMEINYIIRGEEWLPSTPKHIILYQAFGWNAPRFAHISLLLNPDKSKLSKRSGDVAVKDLRAEGYLPEAIINFIATLGWNPSADQEIYGIGEIIKHFEIKDTNKSGVVFNREKLDWMNNHYIREKDPRELTNMCIPYLVNANLIKESEAQEKFEWISLVITLFTERMKKLSELAPESGFLFKKELEYSKELLQWKEMEFSEVGENLNLLIDYLKEFDTGQFTAQNLEYKIKELINENGLENGKVLWPMRVALSGKEKSPPPFNIAEILGKEKTIARLEQAVQNIQK